MHKDARSVRLARSQYKYEPLVLCATKAYWGLEEQLHSFLSSVSFRPLQSSNVGSTVALDRLQPVGNRAL
jgi:hypothetical protein